MTSKSLLHLQLAALVGLGLAAVFTGDDTPLIFFGLWIIICKVSE